MIRTMFLAVACLCGAGCTSPTEGYCDNDTQCSAGKRCNTFFHACEPRTDATIVPDGRGGDGPPRDSMVDGPKSKNGATCGSAGQCQSGYCTDGMCCASRCDSICQSCTLKGSEGTCSPIPSGQDPDKECEGTAAACSGTCDGKGACSFPGSTQGCGASSCVAATLTTYACDAAGACKPATTNCGSYPCAGGTACATSCTEDAGCTGQAFCSQGKCKTWKAVVQASADLTGLGGSSSTNVWAVGGGGTILQYNGTTWAVVSSGTSQDLGKVWVFSPTDVWVTGDFGGKLLHWNATSWAQVSTGCSTWNPETGIWGAVATNLWFTCDPGLVHLAGTSWVSQVLPQANLVNEIWGTSASNVWTAGQAPSSGFIHHFDGSTWTKIYETTSSLLSIWGTSTSNIWAGGVGGLLHFDGTSWTPTSGVTGTVWGIWGSSASEVWAFTASQILHSDGVKWTGKSFAPAPTRIWGASVTDVWAVAGKQILRLQ